MAYTLSYNTPENGTHEATKFTLGKVASADYAPSNTDKPKAGEFTFIQWKGDVGVRETFTLRRSEIPDIYNGSKIARTDRLPSSKGVKLNWHDVMCWSLADSSNTAAPMYRFPCIVDVTLKFPEDPRIKSSDLGFALAHILGVAWSDGSSNIDRWMKGSLTLPNAR